MMVVDASAMVEALTGRSADAALLDALRGDVSAPHLLDVEVLSALRGLHLAGKLDAATVTRARRAHFSWNISRYQVEPFADRIWDLRHRLTTYDATYVALAEVLDAPLYTCDAKILDAGHHVDVRLVPQGD